MTINELDKAAAALAKAGDGHSLRVASQLYGQTGDQEKARILAFQAVEAFKVACDMSGLETLLEKTVIDEVKDKIKLESQQ